MAVQLAASLTLPATPALLARDDPLTVEIQRDQRLARLFALSIEFALGFAKRLAAALTRAQLLGQLITTRLAVKLVFGRVDRCGLLQDLLGDPRVTSVCFHRSVR